jgi:hypothetical protein
MTLATKKTVHGRQGLGIHGTLDFLPVPLHTDQTGPTKFLYVV